MNDHLHLCQILAGWLVSELSPVEKLVGVPEHDPAMCSCAAQKAKPAQGCSKSNIASRAREVRPQLERCLQLCSPQ